MLEGLDRIDWTNLTHAYGSAEDVPDLLRQLASADEDERSEAIHELYGNIWHQGTVYEATAKAVPFLIELLEAADMRGRTKFWFCWLSSPAARRITMFISIFQC